MLCTVEEVLIEHERAFKGGKVLHEGFIEHEKAFEGVKSAIYIYKHQKELVPIYQTVRASSF
jgi:hypothetical protein